MAQKDSQLVIRARDEASKALQAITKAVTEFESAQAGLAGSGAAASSTLVRLAGSIKELGTASAALTGVEKIAGQMARAEKAVEGLESKLSAATADLSTYSAKLAEAAEENAALQKAATTATTAVDKQAKAVQLLAAEQRKLATAEKNAAAAALAASARVQKTPNDPTLLTRKAERDAQAARAKAALAEKSAALEKEKAALASLQAAREPLVRQAAEAAKVEQSFKAAVDAAKFSVENLSAGLGPARAGLAEIKTMFESGAKAAGLETASVEALTAAQNSLKTATASATAALAAEQARQKAAPAPGGRPSPGVTSVAPGATSSPAAAAVTSYKEYAAAKAALESMYQAMSQAGKVTPEMTAALNVQRAAVDAAKESYDRAKAALGPLREAIRAAAAARVEAAASAVREAEAERQAQAAAAALAAEEQRAAAAARAQEAAIGPLTRMVQAYRTAMASAATTTEHAAASHETLGSHVRNLAAAYLSVFTAINAFKGVVDASVNAEAAQVRIATALGQGMEVGAEAYQHAANAARQLRLDILPTVDAYGQFMSVTKDTAIEGDKARKIFDDMLVTMRAFKLSPENMERATLALKDMAAKGNIARREINQLDLAMPVGMFQALAQAAGYSAGNMDEFNKQIKAGKIGLDVLLPAFDIIRQRAEKGLPDALNTAQSALANLRNSIFDLSVAIGQGQFMEGIVAGANALSAALKSDEGINGLRSIAAGLGSILKLMADLLPYTKQIVEALTALAAIKLLGLLGGVGALSTAVRALPALIEGIGVAFASIELTAAGVGTALAGVVTFLTGPVGIAIAVAAIGAGLAAWAMNTSSAEDALRDYQTTMERVKGALRQNGGDLGQVGKGLGDPSVGDVEKTVQKQRESLTQAKTALADYISKLGSGIGLVDAFGNAMDGAADEQVMGLRKIAESYANGKITGDQFRTAVANMQRELTSPEAKEVAESLLKQSQAIKENTDHLADAATAAQGMGSKMEGLDGDIKHGTSSLNDFAASLKNTNDAMAVTGVKAMEDYKTALSSIEAMIPGLKEKLKELKDEANIADNLTKGMAALDQAYKNGAINAEDYRSGKRMLNGATDDAKTATDGTTIAVASALVEHLMQKYGLNREQAVGAAGVMGYESGNFQSLQEKNPVGGGRGGYGYAQWTGPRRNNYDAYLAANPGLDPSSYEGNVGFMDQELSGPYASVIEKIKKAQSTKEAADVWLENYEGMKRPAEGTTTNPDGGIPAYAEHEARAEQYARILPDSPKKDIKEQESDLNKREKDAEADKQADADAEAHTQKELQAEKDLAALAAAKTKAAKDYDDYKKAHPEASAEELSAAKQKIDANVQSLEVEKEVDAFKERNKTATASEVDEYKKLVAAKVAAADAEKSASSGEVGAKHDAIEAEKQLNALVAERSHLIQQMNKEGKTGSGATDAEKQKLQDLTKQVDDLIAKLKEMYQALGGADATAGLARLDAITNDLTKAQNQAHLFGLSMEDTKKIGNDLANDLSSFADNFAKKIAEGEKPMQALRESFLQFASEFLQQIAKMIIQQAIFNALGMNKQGDLTGGGLMGMLTGGAGSAASSAAGVATGAASGGGGLFGSLFSWLGALHGGGIVGSSGASAGRAISPLAFIGASRMHNGGIVGLASNEVPIVAQKNEEMLTASDPRHRNNGGMRGGSQAAPSVKVVNAFDPASFMSHGLSTTEGETAMMNFVRANSGAIKGALG